MATARARSREGGRHPKLRGQNLRIVGRLLNDPVNGVLIRRGWWVLTVTPCNKPLSDRAAGEMKEV